MQDATWEMWSFHVPRTLADEGKRKAGAVRQPQPRASAAQSTLPKMMISFSVSQ
jgi:hypothetical protein